MPIPHIHHLTQALPFVILTALVLAAIAFFVLRYKTEQKAK